MILKLLIALIMLVGLLGTFIPRIPGTLIIAVGAILYSLLSGAIFSKPLAVSLFILVITAELGGRLLRYYLTRKDKISLLYSANSTVGNFAGLIVAGALFGSIIGMIIWELLSGKTWTSKGKEIIVVLAKAMAAAIFRFMCGFVMIILILSYLFV